MGEVRINDEVYGSKNASDIACLNKSGNESNVQTELTTLELNIDNLNLSIPTIKCQLLWSNSASTSSFANNKTITLNDSINNYTFYMVICREEASYGNFFSTGLIPIDCGVKMAIASNKTKWRSVNAPSGTSLKFGSAYKYDSYNVSTSNTSVCIPYRVYGFKFN